MARSAHAIYRYLFSTAEALTRDYKYIRMSEKVDVTHLTRHAGQGIVLEIPVLVAPKRLYKSTCPSVGPSVGPSVRK